MRRDLVFCSIRHFLTFFLKTCLLINVLYLVAKLFHIFMALYLTVRCLALDLGIGSVKPAFDAVPRIKVMNITAV